MQRDVTLFPFYIVGFISAKQLKVTNCSIFWRYKSIIQHLKRLGRYFDNTFLASMLRSSFSIKYHFSKSQSSGKRGNLSRENSVRRYEYIRRYLRKGISSSRSLRSFTQLRPYLKERTMAPGTISNT